MESVGVGGAEGADGSRRSVALLYNVIFEPGSAGRALQWKEDEELQKTRDEAKHTTATNLHVSQKGKFCSLRDFGRRLMQC